MGIWLLRLDSRLNIYTLHRNSVQRRQTGRLCSEENYARSTTYDISDRYEDKQQKRKEEVHERTLGVRKPERRHMGPYGQSYEPKRGEEKGGAAATDQFSVLRWAEAHVKKRENGKHDERDGIEDGDQEEIVSRREQMELQLMEGLSERLMTLEYIHDDIRRPWNADAEQDAGPVYA